MLIKAMHKHS